jgi:hypothetical protein
MQTCIIMDAGCGVDKLVELDDGIKIAHREGGLSHFKGLPDPKRVKSWENVEIHHMNTGGGKSSMQPQFTSTSADAWAPKAVAEFVRDKCPPHEKVLVCTHMDTSHNPYRRILEAAFEDAGVPDYRIAYTHWGQHDATNEHHDAVAVVGVGCWQLEKHIVAAWVLGQLNDPEAEVPTPKQVSEVLSTWVALSLYQLLGRGQARHMTNGQAAPMVFGYLQFGTAVPAILRQLTPGAKEHTWRCPTDALPRHVVDGQTHAAATKIRAELVRCVQVGEHLVTARALKARLGLKSLNAPVFSRAVSQVVADGLWRRQLRSLEYVWAEADG